MSFRYRNVVSLGKYARVNVSKSGASLSVGPRGASINIGPRGVYETVGIPGTGMSWRTRLDKPQQRRATPAPGTAVAAQFDEISAKLDETEREFEHECAALKVREAQVEAQELALEQARETCKTPADAAQLKIMQAKLDVAKLDLKNEHKAAMEAEQNIRSAREQQQKAAEALQKAAARTRFTQVVKFVVAVAVGLFILAKCAGAHAADVDSFDTRFGKWIQNGGGTIPAPEMFATAEDQTSGQSAEFRAGESYDRAAATRPLRQR
jgi:Fe2+ transport system protein B